MDYVGPAPPPPHVAKKKTEAKSSAMKLIWFSVFLSVIIGLVMALCSPLFPKIYKTSDTVHFIATELLFVVSFFMPVHAFTNGTYFTLRSGGKTVMTFIFDSGFVWLCSVPLAFVLSRFTAMPIHWLFVCGQAVEGLKAALSLLLLQRVQWVRRLVGSQTKQ